MAVKSFETWIFNLLVYGINPVPGVEREIAVQLPVVVVPAKSQHLPSLVQVFIQQFRVFTSDTFSPLFFGYSIKIEDLKDGITQMTVKLPGNQRSLLFTLVRERIGQIFGNHLPAVAEDVINYQINEI
jgi:hypothetical protein